MSMQNKLAEALRDVRDLLNPGDSGNAELYADVFARIKAALAEHDAANPVAPRTFAGEGEPTPDPVTVKPGIDSASRASVTWVMVGPHIVAEFYGPRQTANARFLADALNKANGHDHR